MSLISRLLPFLFDEVAAPAAAAGISADKLQQLTPEDKARLARHEQTPVPVLAQLVKDPNADLQLLLAQRLTSLLSKIHKNDDDTRATLLEAIRQLTEESITPVRVALASALKDVANLPPDLARRLANDAERSVAEPIIRFSLSLSDEDLLSLISQHPQDWHTIAIAQRPAVSDVVSTAVVDTGNVDAGQALLTNDHAAISPATLDRMRKLPQYQAHLAARNSLQRRIKREIMSLTQRRLYDFLRQDAKLDKATTREVLKTIERRVEHQEQAPSLTPADMTEQQLRDALMLGETTIVIQALAAKAKTTEDIIRRMIVESGAARPVIALCVKLGLPMSLSVLMQQRLTRLGAGKIMYPKNGDQCPISSDDVQWQLDFFGI